MCHSVRGVRDHLQSWTWGGVSGSCFSRTQENSFNVLNRLPKALVPFIEQYDNNFEALADQNRFKSIMEKLAP